MRTVEARSVASLGDLACPALLVVRGLPAFPGLQVLHLAVRPMPTREDLGLASYNELYHIMSCSSIQKFCMLHYLFGLILYYVSCITIYQYIYIYIIYIYIYICMIIVWFVIVCYVILSYVILHYSMFYCTLLYMVPQDLSLQYENHFYCIVVYYCISSHEASYYSVLYYSILCCIILYYIIGFIVLY